MLTSLSNEIETSAASSVGVEQLTDPFEPLRSEIDLHSRIDHLEAAIVNHLAPIDLTPIHHFAPGVYARELRIPAGVLLTGKIHRTRHLNIVSEGAIAVWCESTGPSLITAPAAFVSEPGTRRIGFALEDTTWTTIHPTDETDLDRLEALLIEPRPLLAVEATKEDEVMMAELVRLLTSSRTEEITS